MFALLVSLQAGVAGAQPTEEDGTAGVVAPPLVRLVGVENSWRSFRNAEPNSEQEVEAFQQLLNIQLELGIPDLSRHATVLVRDADAAWEAGNDERSEILLLWAERLAPHSAEPHLLRYSQSWPGTPWAIVSAIGNLATGYQLAMRSPEVAIVMGLHLWQTVIAVFSVFFAVFLLVQLSRYVAPVANDLSRLFGGLVNKSWVIVSLAVALVFLGVCFGSPIISALALVIVFWAYQRLSERVISLLLVVTILVLPMITGQMGQLVASDQSTSEFFHRAQTDVCDEACWARLDAILASDPTNEPAILVKALNLLRRGLNPAVEQASALLDDSQFSPENTAIAELLKGIASILQGDMETAATHLQAAKDQAETGSFLSLVAHFDHFRTLEHLGREQAEESLRVAELIDHDFVIRFLDKSVLRTNRWIMMTGLPADALYRFALSSGEAGVNRATAEVWRDVGGVLSPLALRAVAVGSLLFLGLLTLFGGSRKHSSKCSACGSVYVRTLKEHCGDCDSLFMEGEKLSSDRRRVLESKMGRYADRKQRITIVGNLLGGGHGFLFAGSAWIGAPLLVLWAAGGVLLFGSFPVAIGPFASLPTSDGGHSLLAFLFLGICYGVGWTLTWLRRRSLYGSNFLWR